METYRSSRRAQDGDQDGGACVREGVVGGVEGGGRGLALLVHARHAPCREARAGVWVEVGGIGGRGGRCCPGAVGGVGRGGQAHGVGWEVGGLGQGMPPPPRACTTNAATNRGAGRQAGGGLHARKHARMRACPVPPTHLLLYPLGDVHLRADAVHAHIGRVGLDARPAQAAQAAAIRRGGGVGRREGARQGGGVPRERCSWSGWAGTCTCRRPD